jgi:ABC-type transport system substrate-binding protein
MFKSTSNFILLMIALLLASCGASEYADIPSRRGEITPSGVKLGGIFRMNESGTPRSFDPVRIDESAGHHIADQMYDGLFKFDDKLDLISGVAASYEVSDDGKTYTLFLQKDIKFHDNACFPEGKGREVKASDVQYCLTRVLTPTSKSTGAWIFEDIVVGAKEFMSGKADKVAGFKTIDEYTFQIELNKPFLRFPFRLAMPFCYLHPREALEYYKDDFFQNPVGTGPFQFVHWKPNQEILMKRNPHYWMKDKDGVQLPYLDGVSCGRINDFKISFLELDLGNLELVQQIHEDLWTNVFDENNQVRPDFAKYKIQHMSLWVTQYYGFNLTKPPFKDNKNLRQAFNYAIDREAIIKYVINGRGIPATGVVPSGIPGYESDVKGYGYDPQKAKQLLADAGYPHGEGLEEITLQLNSGGTVNETIAEAIQEQLRKIGVTINLQIVDWAQHLESIDNNQPKFYRLGWVADYPDPENFIQLLSSKNFPPNGANYSRYSSPEYDKLFEEAMMSSDAKKQAELFKQAEKIAVEDAPWLFLFYTVRYRMMQPYVNNLVYNPQELIFLTNVWLDDMPGEK